MVTRRLGVCSNILTICELPTSEHDCQLQHELCGLHSTPCWQTSVLLTLLDTVVLLAASLVALDHS